MLLRLSYLLTFFISSTLEVPVYALGYRKYLSFLRSFLLVTLANLITHPPVFFGFMSSRWPYLWSVLAAETFAIVVEGCLHFFFVKPLTLNRALSFALLANLFSWQIAPIFTWLFLHLTGLGG